MADIISEMTASVWKVLVQDGDEVQSGDVLMILESMKMEIPIEATQAGVVTVAAEVGQSLQEGDVIASIN